MVSHMSPTAYCEECCPKNGAVILCPLHAAAPSLLKALESMCERYDAPHWDANIKARAAIAQARGKEQS